MAYGPRHVAICAADYLSLARRRIVRRLVRVKHERAFVAACTAKKNVEILERPSFPAAVEGIHHGRREIADRKKRAMSYGRQYRHPKADRQPLERKEDYPLHNMFQARANHSAGEAIPVEVLCRVKLRRALQRLLHGREVAGIDEIVIRRK